MATLVWGLDSNICKQVKSLISAAFPSPVPNKYISSGGNLNYDLSSTAFLLAAAALLKSKYNSEFSSITFSTTGPALFMKFYRFYESIADF